MVQTAQKIFTSMAKTSFVDWFERFYDCYPDSNGDLIEQMHKECRYTMKSCRARARKTYYIIREKRISEAMSEVMESTHKDVSDETKAKAKQLKEKYGEKN